MKNQQYFLRLENATKAWFKVITEDVKIFVPSHMPQRFHKLMTDQNEKLCGPTPESDKAMLQSKYNGYDVFYLNISGLDDWDNSKEIRLIYLTNQILSPLLYVFPNKIQNFQTDHWILISSGWNYKTIITMPITGTSL